MADNPLTADAILAMPAGEAMDVLVATRVLGWRHYPLGWHTPQYKRVFQECPPFSAGLSVAEYVLDWLRDRWGRVCMVFDGGEWIVWRVGDGPHRVADTLPLALCRAALLETLAKEGG